MSLRTSGTAAMSPQVRSFSLLLSLPGELRNHVYQYVLLSTTGLCAQYMCDGKHNRTLVLVARRCYRTTRNVFGEYNQLKYVCRQLYIETATFELKVNAEVLFLKQLESGSSSADQFAAFTRSLSPPRLCWLRTAIVCESSSGTLEPLKASPSRPRAFTTASVIAKLASSCRRVPQVTVKYLLPVEKQSKCLVFACFNFYMQTLRDRDIFPLNHDHHSDSVSSPCHLEKTSWRSLRWREGRNIQDFHASNLTFWPEGAEIEKDWFLTLESDDIGCGLNEAMLREWWGYLEAWGKTGV